LAHELLIGGVIIRYFLRQFPCSSFCSSQLIQGILLRNIMLPQLFSGILFGCLRSRFIRL
jgi:hypothetical protein